MAKDISAVGLSSITKNTRKKSHLIKNIIHEPDKGFSYINDKGKIVLENYGYLGESFGILVYASSRENGEFKLKKWEAFAFSDEYFYVNNMTFHKIDGKLFAFCDDEKTGNEIEFRVNNINDCENYIKLNGKKAIDRLKVNIAGLSSKASIILPIQKNEDYLKVQQKDDDLHKELLNKLRKGDIDAENAILENNFKISAVVRERLKKEDILSVFEAYFLPHGDKQGAFNILGEIKEVKYFDNIYTGEKVVNLLVNATNTTMNIFINNVNLLGYPRAGMRFFGISELQGNVYFEK